MFLCVTLILLTLLLFFFFFFFLPTPPLLSSLLLLPSFQITLALTFPALVCNSFLHYSLLRKQVWSLSLQRVRACMCARA